MNLPLTQGRYRVIFRGGDSLDITAESVAAAAQSAIAGTGMNRSAPVAVIDLATLHGGDAYQELLDTIEESPAGDHG